MTDGPFAEGKEYLGGFTVIEAPDLDAALAWGRSWPGRPRCRSRCGRSPTGPGTDTWSCPSCPARRSSDVFREEYGRAVAVLVRVFGDIDIAEEAVQDAFTVAVQRWPAAGLPPSPAGWIITTARNRAIDRLRREASREDRHAQAALLHARGEPDREEGPVRDDRLRLIFTCCHPALAAGAQVALTLRLLGGLTTAEIAHAFLVPEPTMAQRLVRAKGKIRDAQDPVPGAGRGRSARAAAGGAGRGLPHLQRGLHGELGRPARPRGPRAPRPSGSGGCWPGSCPTSRRLPGCSRSCCSPSRAGPPAPPRDGSLVLLADQDRSRWDRGLIAEGQAIVRQCLRRNQPGPYQIQAAINAVHSDAAAAAATDWRQILQLYDQLVSLAPGPVVALNRAVAVAEVEGPGAALALVDRLGLRGYYLFHAIRADLLRRLGRAAEAALAYDDGDRPYRERRRARFPAAQPRGAHPGPLTGRTGQGASFTTVTKKLSICLMTSMKRSKSTGLLT